MTTREQLEAEARKCSDHWMTTSYAYNATDVEGLRYGFIAGRTVTAEHVEAAAHGVNARLVEAVLAGEVEIEAHGPGISFERDLARAAFRAAGLLIEGEGHE